MSIFPGIRIEGGLFAPDLLDQLLAEELRGQKPRDFGLRDRRTLTEEIAAVFADATKQWEIFQNRLQRLSESESDTTVTRDNWMLPFLSLLSYELRYNRRAYNVGGLTFAISHRAGEPEDAPPVHIVGARQELGRVAPTGRPRLAPHSLVQEFLNRSDALWGLVTNGRVLRLLRDSTYIRRQVYVEFDLQAIFEQQLFQDFAVLFRLLHRSRPPRGADDAPDCLLEQYYRHSVEQGGRVRDHLRDGVEQAIRILANGFLSHRENTRLRGRVTAPAGTSDHLSADELYRQLLRLVYRFLFLLVAEDRGLISNHALYRQHYGLGRFRRLVDRRSAYTDHEDLWLSLRVLWLLLADDRPVQPLGGQPFASTLDLPVLNGELFEPLVLDECLITNRHLLEALWHLINYRESPTVLPRRVNYAALDTEELGSVYESLLEFEPTIDAGAGSHPTFDLVPLGGQRRSTGSFYTPPELVAPLLEHALKPVFEERLARAGTREGKIAALLSLKVCDPAAGSGHFLLAAARYLGKELARLRTDEEEPAPERVRECIREVISHCIYGVDKNPLAVELCRVALWLEAHTAGHPLTFLNHSIRCGDSLVGLVDLRPLADGIPDEAYKPVHGDNRQIANEAKRANASQRRGRLFQQPFEESIQRFAEPIRKLESMPEDTTEQIRHKVRICDQLHRSAEFRSLRLACDVWTAAFFQRYVEEAGPPIVTLTLQDAVARGSLPDPRQATFVFQASQRHGFFHWPLAFPEVFAAGGFHVILGNPPFLGGLRISGMFGNNYRKWIQQAFRPFGGTADLCAAFYRRAFDVLQDAGRLGMIATNTIGQGDTRKSGLRVIVSRGGAINFAKRFVKWPGAASVEVNLVAIHKSHQGASAAPYSPVLDEQCVEHISSRLDDAPEADPRRLSQNEGKAFIGDYVRGIGFVLDCDEAEALLAKDPRNADCLFPYLNGEDLNSHPEQKPSRWVICFHDWELERAREYPELLRIVEERVRPQRERLRGPGDRRNREYWWQFGAYRSGMRRAIGPLRRVLVRAEVSQLHMISFVPKDWIYSHMLIVFAFDDDYHFALLQSNVHEAWLRRQASSLRTDVRYTPTDCFATFPFPPQEYTFGVRHSGTALDSPQTGKGQSVQALLRCEPFATAARIGAEYHEHRRQIMLARNQGLTATYNLFHNPDCTDADIQRLRELHAEMDRAILACYDWTDLDLGHGFHQNERGQTRFTVSPEARRSLLRRLLDLNLRLADDE